MAETLLEVDVRFVEKNNGIPCICVLGENEEIFL